MSDDRVVLDTNIVIAYLNGEQSLVNKLMALTRPSLSVVVLGELFFGALNSTKVDHNLSRIESFSAICAILPITEKTSRIFGHIKSELKRSGTPIPENDIWIAAQCREHGCRLMTRDNHFAAVTQLSVLNG